jgi:hypothetical protein
MKRALTAAIFGGLLAFSVPQAAFADHEAGHEAAQPEAAESESAEPEGSPPKEQPYADRESEGGDEEGDFILF